MENIYVDIGAERVKQNNIEMYVWRGDFDYKKTVFSCRSVTVPR